MNNELTIQSNQLSAPMSVSDLVGQIKLIQDVMSKVMKDGEHFGKIPGCGDKPALLKAGAEKLSFVFKMAPLFQVEERNLDRGHKEFRVICTMQGRDGTILGSGVGFCSTMESKWRFRTGQVTPTDRQVPKEYWNIRKEDPKKAQELIGGRGFATKKLDGVWMICEQGEKVEHDNPADNYNTCFKMAKKRAQVDATLTCTAASDIFTQDIEEMVENDPQVNVERNQENDPIQKNRDVKDGADQICISPAQGKRLWVICKSKNVTEEVLKAYLFTKGVKSSKEIQRKDYDAICGMVESGGLSPKEGVQEEPEEHSWDAASKEAK